MAAAPIFRQTPVADETPKEFPVCFPPGTIFRLSRASDPQARITALVKNDGRLRLLRYNEFTWKNSEMAKVPTTFHDMTPDQFLSYMEIEDIMEDTTITADVRPQRDFWPSYRLFKDPIHPQNGLLKFRAAVEIASKDWCAYMEQLQALYPIFKTIKPASGGMNVPLRMTAPPQPREAPPALQQPTLLMPPSAVPSAAPNQEAITLTRDDMAYIYTMASGRAFTDDVWASMKRLASR